jgi:dTDP-4-dehydrorhamnose 3,5-epimerase
MIKRDDPGPDHRPDVRSDYPIDGVVTIESPFVQYLGDNVPTELYRPEWVGIFREGETVEHLYTVEAASGGMRDEWYYHEHTLDRYMLLDGLLDVGLWDPRPNSPTKGAFFILSLGEPGSGLPNGVRIPPLVWHSLRWNSQAGMLLNAKTPPFAQAKPDKVRISPEDYPPEIIW